MNEQDTQTVERVAAAMMDSLDTFNDPGSFGRMHKDNPQRKRFLAVARAAIAAMPDTTAQADTIKALTEALTECAEAFELHASAYPAMVKGYTLDALMTARTTLVAVAAAKESL